MAHVGSSLRQFAGQELGEDHASHGFARIKGCDFSGTCESRSRQPVDLLVVDSADWLSPALHGRNLAGGLYVFLQFSLAEAWLLRGLWAVAGASCVFRSIPLQQSYHNNAPEAGSAGPFVSRERGAEGLEVLGAGSGELPRLRAVLDFARCEG